MSTGALQSSEFQSHWKPLEPQPLEWNHGVAVAYRKKKYRPTTLRVELQVRRQQPVNAVVVARAVHMLSFARTHTHVSPQSKSLLGSSTVATGEVPLTDVADYTDAVLSVPLTPSSDSSHMQPGATLNFLVVTAFIPAPATVFINDFDAFVHAGGLRLTSYARHVSCCLLLRTCSRMLPLASL